MIPVVVVTRQLSASSGVASRQRRVFLRANNGSAQQLLVRASSSLTRRNSTSSAAAASSSQTTSPWTNPIEYLKKFIEQEDYQPEFYANRPQTAFERIRNFPLGVKALLRDCLRYQAIQDTPIHSWSIDHPDGQQIQLGRLPRREYLQQLQLVKDFKKMLPLVIIWIPPIIGFLPPLLAIVAPRQSMSSHFHNLYELESFAQTEYRQRIKAFPDLVDFLCGPIHLGTKVHQGIANALMSDNWSGDKTEPMLNAVALYKSVFAGVDGGDVLTFENLPRDYLVQLSLASGINQRLPGWASPLLTEFQPSWWLQNQLKQTSAFICEDDAMLMEEGHHLNGCLNLSDREVTEACLVRGLPVTKAIDAERRRQSLTNHLKMIAAVRKDPVTRVDSDGFRLFTLHLAPIQNYLNSLGNRSTVH